MIKRIKVVLARLFKYSKRTTYSYCKECEEFPYSKKNNDLKIYLFYQTKRKHFNHIQLMIDQPLGDDFENEMIELNKKFEKNGNDFEEELSNCWGNCKHFHNQWKTGNCRFYKIRPFKKEIVPVCFLGD